VIRLVKLLGVAATVVILATALPADAATPASATISLSKRTVSWQGADATFSSVAFDPAGLGNDCNLTRDPFCDHFLLKINLAYDAKLQLQIKGENPSNAVKPFNDFDVFVYPPGAGKAPIAAGTSDSGNETVEFVHRARFRSGSYDIAVQPYVVLPGASYRGTVRVLSIEKG
jgi:hypothetical protein